MHTFLRFSLFGFAIASLFSHCISADSTYTRVPPGMWRGVLVLQPFQGPTPTKKDSITLLTEQFKPGELPFNFEVKYLDDTHFYLEIINGSERIRVDSIQYGRDRTQARDTMNAWFPEYASYIHAEIRGGVMSGEWVLTSKDNYRIPFYAHAGKGYRFTTLNEKPLKDLSGEWATIFSTEKGPEEQEHAIGEFKQDGNHLEGTFRTETGDYRFLEGTVQGRKFWLSCFDGAHAYLFSGSIVGDTLQGEYRSGHKYQTLWEAWKDPNFKLRAADSLAGVKPGAKITFSTKTAEGTPLGYPSSAFEGKVNIFTVMGTWCPNCRDEQLFLMDYMKKHPEQAKDIKVTCFAFERFKDPAKASSQILEYKHKLGIPFDIVYAGNAGKEDAMKFFPALDQVVAFPTMIIIDKQNRVRRVHTGFDGPATSKYPAFQAGFASLMDELLKTN